MKKMKDDSKQRMQIVLSAIGSFAAVTCTSSFLISRYSAADLWSDSRAPFTEAEKQSMFQRTAAPREAIEAMRQRNRSVNTATGAKVVSPWAKAQP